MKVLFLDFDGVLNSEQHYQKWPQWELLKEPASEAELAGIAALQVQFPNVFDDGNWLYRMRSIDPECVERLNRIVRETGTKFVISSSWRKGHSCEMLQALLNYHGFIGEIIGMTPRRLPTQRMSEYVPRGREIIHWLYNEAKEEVDAWVILDDDDNMEGCKWKLVRTSFDTGVSDADVERCIRILGKVGET